VKDTRAVDTGGFSKKSDFSEKQFYGWEQWSEHTGSVRKAATPQL
jgi:hypothetical protein